MSGTEHARILRAEEETLSWKTTQILLDALNTACDKFDCDKVRQLMLQAPTGYSPEDEAFYDSAWTAKQQRRAQTSGQVIQLDSSALKATKPS